MSTRAQIAVYENAIDSIPTAIAFMYIHHDGNPAKVLPRLISALGVSQDRSVDILAARISNAMQPDAIGNQIHDDIEFFYHVSANSIAAYEVSESNEFSLIEDIALNGKGANTEFGVVPA